MITNSEPQFQNKQNIVIYKYFFAFIQLNVAQKQDI